MLQKIKDRLIYVNPVPIVEQKQVSFNKHIAYYHHSESDISLKDKYKAHHFKMESVGYSDSEHDLHHTDHHMTSRHQDKIDVVTQAMKQDNSQILNNKEVLNETKVYDNNKPNNSCVTNLQTIQPQNEGNSRQPEPKLIMLLSGYSPTNVQQMYYHPGIAPKNQQQQLPGQLMVSYHGNNLTYISENRIPVVDVKQEKQQSPQTTLDPTSSTCPIATQIKEDSCCDSSQPTIPIYSIVEPCNNIHITSHHETTAQNNVEINNNNITKSSQFPTGDHEYIKNCEQHLNNKMSSTNQPKDRTSPPKKRPENRIIPTADESSDIELNISRPVTVFDNQQSNQVNYETMGITHATSSSAVNNIVYYTPSTTQMEFSTNTERNISSKTTSPYQDTLDSARDVQANSNDKLSISRQTSSKGSNNEYQGYNGLPTMLENFEPETCPQEVANIPYIRGNLPDCQIHCQDHDGMLSHSDVKGMDFSLKLNDKITCQQQQQQHLSMQDLEHFNYDVNESSANVLALASHDYCDYNDADFRDQHYVVSEGVAQKMEELAYQFNPSNNVCSENEAIDLSIQKKDDIPQSCERPVSSFISLLQGDASHFEVNSQSNWKQKYETLNNKFQELKSRTSELETNIKALQEQLSAANEKNSQISLLYESKITPKCTSIKTCQELNEGRLPKVAGEDIERQNDSGCEQISSSSPKVKAKGKKRKQWSRLKNEETDIKKPRIKDATTSPNSAFSVENEDCLVELVADSNIFIQKSKLTTCLLKSRQSPTMLMRFLLDVFFKPEVLASSSASGRGHAKRPPLDAGITTVLITYIKQRFDCTDGDMIQAINQKCTDARKVLKRQNNCLADTAASPNTDNTGV